MYSKLGRSITNDEFDFRIKDSEFLRIDDYIDSKTSIRFKCKSCGRIYKKPPKAFSTLTCKCLDNKNNYLNSLVSKNITILEPYINAKTKIEHQCNNCGLTFKSLPRVVKNSKIGCPSCSGKIFSLDKYISLLPNDIELLSKDYLGSNKKLKHKCLKCGYIWETKPNNIIHIGCGCPRCSLSKGEREIYGILDRLRIKYIHQYKVNINGLNYKFDFYLEDMGIYIEFDGIQHFKPIDYFGGLEQYTIIMRNDNIKNNWIIENNYNLLRISYLEDIESKLYKYLKNIERNMLERNKILDFKSFNEGKDKFPNIKKMDIDGFTVYIGRDAKSNDYLTFNMSDISDIWMHVKGFPGSHSVILIRENLPTPEVIRKVAELTKKNSKAKSLPNITVIYCKRKFVRKVNGQNDGQVTVDYKNTNEIII